MRKFIILGIFVISFPLSCSSNPHQNGNMNDSWKIHFEIFTLQSSDRYFNNISDLLQFELSKINDLIDFETAYIYENETQYDTSGCSLFNTTMKCKKVDIFEAAKTIPTIIVHLDISNSPVQILRTPIFKNLTNLTELKLTNNSIRYVTSKLFQGLEQLLLLNLSNNNIMALTKIAFVNCPNLRTIDLSKNRIISLKLIPAAFVALKNLSAIILSDNNIRIISKQNMIPLKNSPIEHLDLSMCNLSFIERGSLGILPNLQTLILAANPIDEESLFNITSNLRSIRTLDLRYLPKLNNFPQLAISAMENSSLQILDLSLNHLTFLPNNSFGFLPNLTYLKLSNCEITNIENGAFDPITSLEILDLSSNYLKEPPLAITVLANLRILFLNSQKFGVNEKHDFDIPAYIFSNLSSLNALVLNWNNMKIIRKFYFYNLDNLRILLMTGCDIEVIYEYSFSSLTSLETLELSYNSLFFVSNNTFNGLRNLKTLSLKNNGFFLGKKMYPFIQTPSLEKLFISNNKIKILRPGIFSNMSHLKLIDMQNNEVVSWSNSIFESTTLPKTFVLNNNEIDRITPEMLDDFNGIDHLVVSYNPFDCYYCGTKTFQTWLLNNENETVSDPLMYTCSSPQDLNGQSLLTVNMKFDHCLQDNSMTVAHLVAGMTTFVIVFSILVVILLRFKWYFRYWCFHLQSTFRRFSVSSYLADNYRYDAFVSYNSVDVAWVAHELIPNLEISHSNLRLCIHDRDFDVGRLITENILDAIDQSRKVVIVLTDSFVKSQWCMYELHVAQHQLFHHARDTLILIQIGLIDKTELSKTLRYLMKTRTHLIWPEDPDKRTEFWNRLYKILTK